jgi:hypothetical protein
MKAAFRFSFIPLCFWLWLLVLVLAACFLREKEAKRAEKTQHVLAADCWLL